MLSMSTSSANSNSLRFILKSSPLPWAIKKKKKKQQKLHTKYLKDYRYTVFPTIFLHFYSVSGGNFIVQLLIVIFCNIVAWIHNKKLSTQRQFALSSKLPEYICEPLQSYSHLLLSVLQSTYNYYKHYTHGNNPTLLFTGKKQEHFRPEDSPPTWWQRNIDPLFQTSP